MFSSRDISGVRSSVIPSAKYCWSGSLPRLAKGSTTIDRRGAARGWVNCVEAAPAGVDVGEGLVIGDSHQAVIARTRAAAIAATVGIATRRRRGTTIGTRLIGNSATASGAAHKPAR